MDIVQTAHKLTYNRNVALAVQQMTSRFEMGFTYAPELKGRTACMLELIGQTTAIIDGNRGGDTPNIDANVEPVWVVPHQIEWGKLIEKEDQIKALTDYQSPFVQNGAKAIVRGRDSVFATSIFADRKIGQDGATTSSYDTTNRVVAVGVGHADGTTAIGMNVKKIQRAKRYLRQAYVDLDMEELWGVMNAQGHEELYNDLITINTDFAKMAVLDHDTKRVNEVAGVKFVSYEGMADYDGSTYTSAIWCKSGMHYGDFDPLTTRAEPNPMKKYRIHPYMENWFGASRSEDAKVIKVLNKK